MKRACLGRRGPTPGRLERPVEEKKQRKIKERKGKRRGERKRKVCPRAGKFRALQRRVSMFGPGFLGSTHERRRLDIGWSLINIQSLLVTVCHFITTVHEKDETNNINVKTFVQISDRASESRTVSKCFNILQFSVTFIYTVYDCLSKDLTECYRKLKYIEAF